MPRDFDPETVKPSPAPRLNDPVKVDYEEKYWMSQQFIDELHETIHELEAQSSA